MMGNSQLGPRSGERGSLLALTAVLLLMVVAVGMAVIEVAWVQYVRVTAQQAADFAAEAGARMREEFVTYKVEHNRMRIKQTLGPDGLLYDDGYEWDGDPTPDFKDINARTSAADVWRQMCPGSKPLLEDVCVSGPIESRRPGQEYSRRLEFHADADAEAARTFMENWRDRGAAYLLAEPEVTERPEERSMEVGVTLIVRPLYLGVLNTNRIFVSSKAKVQLAGTR